MSREGASNDVKAEEVGHDVIGYCIVNILHSLLCLMLAKSQLKYGDAANFIAVPVSLCLPHLIKGLLLLQRVVSLTVGPSFKYTIPNSEAVVVELRQTRVEQTLESGEAERYDAFIRNDSGLSCIYPATVLAKSTFTICSLMSLPHV